MSNIPKEFANRLPHSMAHKSRRGFGPLIPIILGTAILGLMALTIILIDFRSGTGVSAVVDAAAIGEPQTYTPTAEVHVTEVVKTRVVIMEQTRIVPVEQTQIVIVQQTQIVPITPTPQPSRTPIPPTPTSAYLVLKAHNDNLQRQYDRRISFAWNVLTFGGLPLLIVGVFVLVGWLWFRDRDRLIDSLEVVEDVDELRAEAIAKARAAEQAARDEHIQAIPISGVGTKQPKPTVEDTAKIAAWLIQGGMSRSAIAMKVYGNSGGSNLPKVDYVIKTMQANGLLTTDTPDM